jgi:hypothetical protein
MKKYAILIMLLYFGCRNKQIATVSVHLSQFNDHKSLRITGISQAILNDIDRDSVKNWESLFAIYRLPADTDMKDYQPIQPGRYRLMDSSLVFTPDTPFVKRQSYFLRYYNYADNKTLWDYLKGKTTKGQLHYTDLIFKQ